MPNYYENLVCSYCKTSFRAKEKYRYCFDCLTYFRNKYTFKDCSGCKKPFKLDRTKDYEKCYDCFKGKK